ncbi:hypothetical protein HanPSC8_Chr10g0442391 [Helianthus annuus]|nr:hypothetical protein HanPSC8_Chr10g0442391 [Helianthus annuus]
MCGIARKPSPSLLALSLPISTIAAQIVRLGASHPQPSLPEDSSTTTASVRWLRHQSHSPLSGRGVAKRFK